MKELNKVFMDLLNLRTEYFREVGSKLSGREVENFLAYSQHHGLPTELLDITQNPLVALYFACSSETADDGYLYLFDDTTYGGAEYGRRQFQYSPYRDLSSRLFTSDDDSTAEHLKNSYNGSFHKEMSPLLYDK